jgi:hypothetical protein
MSRERKLTTAFEGPKQKPHQVGQPSLLAIMGLGSRRVNASGREPLQDVRPFLLARMRKLFERDPSRFEMPHGLLD